MKTRTSHGQHTLGRDYFVSETVYRDEIERIFMRSWLPVGHVGQLHRPGSYFVFELESESVIVLRGDDGEIRAFHNLCRHRGSRLCQEAHGDLGERIVCPYHAWTYGRDGALLRAPAMEDVTGFDPAAYALKPAALHIWEGLVFVNLDAQPATFEDELGGLDARFANWQLPLLRVADRRIYDVDANWKMFFHNFSECYHCPLAHPQLNALTPFRDSQNDLEEGAVLGGPMHLRDRDGSMSVGGKRCAPVLPLLDEQQRGRVFYYTIFPGAFISFHPDYVMLHRALPLAIDKTRIVCEWYFHPEAIAEPGFDAKPAVDFWDLTNRQDWELCVNAYRGVCSRAWQAGPYSELESQLAAFDRHYLCAMQHEEDSRKAGLGSA